MQRENERLKGKSGRLKDELAELQEEARERRARHVQKFGILENFGMLVAAVALAAVASRWEGTKRRSRKNASRE